jgi:hypothetical protein
MPNGTGFATPTIVNSPVPFSYIGTGATLPLAIGFVPNAVRFWAGSLSWEWCDGMAFGQAKTATLTYSIENPVTGGVLDKLTGSGRATTNVATTSSVIGLLIGTNTTVNNGAGLQYFGLCYR